MIAKLVFGAIGALLVWIGIDTMRGGNWWKPLSTEQKDALIGLPPSTPNDANQPARTYMRTRFGSFLSASPLLGLVATLAGLLLLTFSLGLIE